MLTHYADWFPEIHATAFIADSAEVIGNVRIGRDASVWFQAVVRGDVNAIRIGERTNIQDGAIIHGTLHTYPVAIGDDVTIGHGAIVHGCMIHSHCLIGMGAIILDDATIGEHCIIGAGAVVTEHTMIPPRSVVMGVPGTVRRPVTAQEVHELHERAARYVEYKNRYLNDHPVQQERG
jgi:gamma-carbonic anhydrase